MSGPAPHRRPTASWLVTLTAMAGTIALLRLGHAPSAYLLGSAVGAMAAGMVVSPPRNLLRTALVGQVIVGASIGSLLSPQLLTVVGSHLAFIGLTVGSTIAVSLAWGQLLRLSSGVSASTAALASIAGGASGIVATAHESGADPGIVIAIQYLRVLAVLALMPLAIHVLGDPKTTTFVENATPPAGQAPYAYAGVVVALGLLLTRLFHFTGSALLLSMLAAAALEQLPAFASTQIPLPVQNLAYVLVGAQVGLRLDRRTLATLRRLLPLAALQTAGTVLVVALIGLALASPAGIGPRDAYLATTPGGLYAVIAVATSLRIEPSLIFATQITRVFMVVALVPFLSRGTRRQP